MKLTKRRVAELQSTIESARMNADHASRLALVIWEEWNPRKGVTQKERDSMIDSLTDARIHIGMAIEQLEKARH